jgi:hypothetical protein
MKKSQLELTKILPNKNFPRQLIRRMSDKKVLSYLFIILVSTSSMDCDVSVFPNTPQIPKTFKGYGYVEGLDIRVGLDTYIFGGADSFTPLSQGFVLNDYVYFIVEISRSKENSSRGTTYWCRLLSIRKG